MSKTIMNRKENKKAITENKKRRIVRDSKRIFTM